MKPKSVTTHCDRCGKKLGDSIHTCTPTQTMKDSRKMLLELQNEIDCCIQHGCNSNGHLDYILKELNEIIARMDDEQGI